MNAQEINIKEHGYRYAQMTNPFDYDDPDDAPTVILSPDNRVVTYAQAVAEIENNTVAKLQAQKEAEERERQAKLAEFEASMGAEVLKIEAMGFVQVAITPFMNFVFTAQEIITHVPNPFPSMWSYGYSVTLAETDEWGQVYIVSHGTVHKYFIHADKLEAYKEDYWDAIHDHYVDESFDVARFGDELYIHCLRAIERLRDKRMYSGGELFDEAYYAKIVRGKVVRLPYHSNIYPDLAALGEELNVTFVKLPEWFPTPRNH